MPEALIHYYRSISITSHNRVETVSNIPLIIEVRTFIIPGTRAVVYFYLLTVPASSNLSA